MAFCCNCGGYSIFVKACHVWQYLHSETGSECAIMSNIFAFSELCIGSSCLSFPFYLYIYLIVSIIVQVRHV